MKTSKAIVYCAGWGNTINVPAGRQMNFAHNLPDKTPDNPLYFLGGWRGMTATERSAVRTGILVHRSEVR